MCSYLSGCSGFVARMNSFSNTALQYRDTPFSLLERREQRSDRIALPALRHMTLVRIAAM